MTSIVKHEPLQLRSNGKYVRDYIYVKDVANAYLILAEKLKNQKIRGHAFNFSNETPINGRLNGCPHHREGVGCVLKELKGPKCLDYIDLYIDDEIERRFGVCLMPIKPYLDRVGLAGADQNIIPLTLHPEVNDEFTLKTIGAINQVTDYIKGFPILPK